MGGLSDALSDSLSDAAVRDLMAIHIRTLFRCDPAGRLLHVNEPEAPRAPCFYMGRTQAGNFWHFRHDLPAEVMATLDPLCRAEPPAADLTQPPHYAAHYATEIGAVLQADGPLAHATTGRIYSGPAYWIDQDSPVPAHVVLISQENAYLLGEPFEWMRTILHSAEASRIGPVAAAVVQGQAVSLCFCSRLPGQATEAGVETLPAFRGQGHATAAVAGWAAAVRRAGWLPLYSTSWENLASQAIARKLHMKQYGADWSIQ